MKSVGVFVFTMCALLGGLDGVSVRGAQGPGEALDPAVPFSLEASKPAGPAMVVDSEGQPLAGVTLSTQPPPVIFLPESITETTVSQGSDGGAINRPPREVPGVYFLLRKPGHETLALNGARPLPGRITMPPGRRITGTVMSPDGQPIAGAVVGPISEAESSTGNRQGSALVPRVAVRTGGDGSFVLEDMPLRGVRVQLWAQGYAPRFVSFGMGEDQLNVALAKAGGGLRGTVVGSKDRAPQVGIPIEARSGEGLLVFTTTDANGGYAFDNLTNGTWHVRPAGGGPLSGTQSRTVTVEIEEGGEAANVPLVLNQGVMLAGRAVDVATSGPLAGINITLAGYAGQGARAVLTEADGSFEFENLDSMQDVIIRFDPFQFVYLLPNGDYRDYFDLSQAGDTDFDLTTLTVPLHRRLRVEGGVSDGGGQPVADAQVHLQALDMEASAPSKSGPRLLSFFTQSNSAGRFVAGVYPAGQYKVWAEGGELVSQVETVDIFTTAPQPELSLRLDQPAQLHGVLTDASDRPVTGGIVIAWPANAPEPADDPPIPGRETYAFTRSDREGNFTLSGLRGEPLRLRGLHGDYFQRAEMDLDPRELNGAGTTTTVALKFPAGGEFTVNVTDDGGRPLSQAKVLVEYRTGLDGQRAAVVTDRFGRAFGGGIPAKQLERVTITHPMYASFNQDGPIPLPINGITVALQRRASLVGLVTGQAEANAGRPEILLLKAPLSPDGGAPPDNTFDFVNRGSASAGRVVFPSLPEGWYKLAFADAGAYAESDVVKIEAGSEDQELTIELPVGNVLLGVITDKSSGDPIAGANVSVRPAVQSQVVAEQATQNARTDSEGMFQLQNIGAGQLRFRVIANGYPDYERTMAFSADDPIHIELTNEPAEVAGRVVAGGQPVEGALLILATAGEAHEPVATATSDGAGHYRLDGFSAGSYALSVEAPIGDGDNIARKTMTIDVEGGENSQDVEFSRLVTVTGRVRLGGQVPSRPGGEPIALLFRGSRPDMESKMVVLENGSYSTQLEAGDYVVSLDDMEGRPVTINGGNNQSLHLDF